MLGGFVAPPLGQRGGRLVLLGLPGGLYYPLDQLGGPQPTLGLESLHLAIDRIRPLGEHPQQVLWHAGQLAVAPPVRLAPGDPKRPCQGALVGAPVDRIRRHPVPVQVATIQRRPATIRTPDTVRNDHVGVQQRIACPRGPMVEPDRQQAVAGHMVAASMAAAGADVLLEVAERFGGRLVVGVQHMGGDLGVAQAVQQRHALGRPQHHIEGRYAPLAVAAAKQLACLGVAAVEHPHERLGTGGAFLAERLGPPAEPAAW